MKKSLIIYFKRFWFLVAFLGIAFNGNTQNNTGCLTEFQLLKMQKAALGDIRVFLAGEGWELTGVESDPEGQSNTVKWQKPGYINGETIFLYQQQNKFNIVVYNTVVSCFEILFKSLTSTKTGQTKVLNNRLVTSFYEKDIMVEFHEYIEGHLNQKYSILIYNKSSADSKTIKYLSGEEDDQTKSETENMQNIAYYIIGTVKDLKEKKVIDQTGGFVGIGKAKNTSGVIDNTYFTKVDVTTFNELPIMKKKAVLLTNHPVGSYKFEGINKQAVEKILIVNASDFWSRSKYLVIVAE
jgi:hypothetical protein